MTSVTAPSVLSACLFIPVAGNHHWAREEGEGKKKHLLLVLPVGSPAWDLVDSVEEYSSRQFNFHGRVISKYFKNIYLIKLDLLPATDSTDQGDEVKIARENITVLYKDEEEKPFERVHITAEATAESCSTTKKIAKTAYVKKPFEEFTEMDTTAKQLAKTFTYYWYGLNKQIQWEILAEDEQVTKCSMEEYHSSKNKTGNDIGDDIDDDRGVVGEAILKSPFKKTTPWDADPTKTDYHSIFFQHFYPDLKGGAMLIDEYLGDRRCGLFDTVDNDKIKFHILTTMIQINCNEAVKGIVNLWKWGESAGLKEHPDYGKYIPKHYFKAFMAAFPFVWADNKFWYRNPKELPWEFIIPFKDEYNKKRRSLLLQS
ncbi:hypothetical protein ACHAXR_008375 [Thalassiosira sp. AJA248-18]